jgi:hypothetical protein
MRAAFLTATLLCVTRGCLGQTCNPKMPASFVAGFVVIQGQIRLEKNPAGKYINLGISNLDRLNACLQPQHPTDTDILQQTLASDLDAALARRPLFVWYALPSGQQKAALPATVPDCLKSSGKQSWQEYQTCFAKFGDAIKLRSSWSSFRTGLAKDIGALKPPLIPVTADFQQAHLTFDIVAYGGMWSDRLPNPMPAAFPIPREVVARYLDEYDDGLWRAGRIKTLLTDFFSRRGWAPNIFPSVPATAPSASTPSIAISAITPVAQVTFLPPVPRADRERVLSRLLSTAQFDQARQLPVTASTAGTSFEAIDLTTVAPPVLFNSLVFSTEQTELPALGFTAAPTADLENNAVNIVVQREASTPAPKDKRGFLGGGFDYRPGQGVRPLAQVEYQRLFGPGSVSLQTGSANQFLYATGTASFDFIGFSRLHRRLEVQMNGGTDVVNNRLIDQQKLDERRSGGKVHLELEMLRDPMGHSLVFYAEAADQAVKLNQDSSTVHSDHLTTIQLGAPYTWSRMDAAAPYRFRCEPRWKRGIASAGWYSRFEVAAQFHQESVGRLVFEVNARFADATRSTPVYELPSFGGVDSVRGFRADDLLARRVWSAQPELWLPLPGVADSMSSAGRLLARARLATFVDAGGAYQTRHGATGWRGGPGIGLRIPLGPATLRADWAHPIGGAITQGPSYGRFYFSLSSPLI